MGAGSIEPVARHGAMSWPSITAALLMLGLSSPALAGQAAPPQGTVAVALAADSDASDEPFADAVGQALGAIDFTLLPEHSRFIAEVSVVREHAGLAQARATRDRVVASPLAVQVPLPSKKTVLRDLVKTTLTVRLFTRAGHATVWSGSAITAAIDGTPVAAKLARAVVALYPQTLRTPVSVP